MSQDYSINNLLFLKQTTVINHTIISFLKYKHKYQAKMPII